MHCNVDFKKKLASLDASNSFSFEFYFIANYENEYIEHFLFHS